MEDWRREKKLPGRTGDPCKECLWKYYAKAKGEVNRTKRKAAQKKGENNIDPKESADPKTELCLSQWIDSLKIKRHYHQDVKM